jgi:RHH-type proline utilization regulon transcriptional repressor/proline dehydrogenase/delta 1-pyrroline-5-carboxylate dehydrogenase
LIEIGAISELTREVFGPVLHVLRYRRDDLEVLIDNINATGYGLTFGVHTRIDETIDRVTRRIEAGNLYINRNIIGAVVGLQPFGGRGLSGTGPKAGGPLYLRRLLSARPAAAQNDAAVTQPPGPSQLYCSWLEMIGRPAEADRCRAYMKGARPQGVRELPGPVGERNLYEINPRGTVLALPQSGTGLLLQIGAALATGNDVLVRAGAELQSLLRELPPALSGRVQPVDDSAQALPIAAVLAEEGGDALVDLNRRLASRPGPIVGLQAVATADLVSGAADYDLDRLLEERSISINTAAAGGNASLMTIG